MGIYLMPLISNASILWSQICDRGSALPFSGIYTIQRECRRPLWFWLSHNMTSIPPHHSKRWGSTIPDLSIWIPLGCFILKWTTHFYLETFLPSIYHMFLDVYYELSKNRLWDYLFQGSMCHPFLLIWRKLQIHVDQPSSRSLLVKL